MKDFAAKSLNWHLFHIHERGDSYFVQEDPPKVEAMVKDDKNHWSTLTFTLTDDEGSVIRRILQAATERTLASLNHEGGVSGK